MLLKLKTILTLILLLSSLSSFACSCAEIVPFCDNFSESSTQDPLVFIGEATGNCVEYLTESGNQINDMGSFCEVRVYEIISGNIEQLDAGYPVANTYITLWIYSLNPDSDCSYLPPTGMKVYAPLFYGGNYNLSICHENLLSLNNGQVSGFITTSESQESMPWDDFLETIESCLPGPDCGDFDAWVAYSNCNASICGAYYDLSIFITGYDKYNESIDTFTIINNFTGDTSISYYVHPHIFPGDTAISYVSTFISPNIFVEDPYSFTIYQNSHPECRKTIEGQDNKCHYKIVYNDVSGYYTIPYQATDYTDLVPNNLLIQNDEFDASYFYDPPNTGDFSTTLNVLANDPCSPDCVLFVDGDATELFGQTLYENDENNANITINDDCTITYEINAANEYGDDFFIYGFLNWQGDTVYAVAKINIYVAVPDPILPTFEVYPEIVCDKVSGTFSMVLNIFEPSQPIADNYQYRVCEGDWIDLDDSNSNGLVYQIPEIYVEGSGVCLEIRDTDNIEAIFPYYLEVVSCFTVAIELLSFDGINTSYGNKLNWATATEKDNDYFILEKSFDGSSFNPIARIHSNGDSNIKQDYQYVDTENTNQTCYYRLVTVEHSGKREIASKVINLLPRQILQDIVLYPLPAKNFIYLDVVNDLNETVEIDVFDVSGKLIQQKTFEVENGQNHLRMNVNALSDGIYVLNYKSSKGSIVKRFVK